MTASIRQSPYLREQRHFPTDNAQALSIEVDRAYVDTAQKINTRTIGIFAQNFAVVTGEQWFFNGKDGSTGGILKNQTLRQLYIFSSVGNIPHGINISQIQGISRIFGTFTDGTNWYPLPYVDVVSATNQVSVIITPTNIVIAAGGGSPPAIISGTVVLEWLSLV